MFEMRFLMLAEGSTLGISLLFFLESLYGVMLGLYPLIVVDMHEHAYFKDYQTDRKSFLVSQMRELNWNTIEDRVKKAENLHEAIK